MTAWNHVRAVLLLPVMNVIVIPSVILAATRDFAAPFASAGFAGVVTSALAVGALLLGLALVVRSIAFFVRLGNGTLAPWDPTQRLIGDGPYRYLRNPMKAGLFVILVAECVLLQSASLALWAGSFILANILYIRLSEEPGLHARFGRRYADYCAAVPRWWPRPTGWRGPPTSAGQSS